MALPTNNKAPIITRHSAPIAIPGAKEDNRSTIEKLEDLIDAIGRNSFDPPSDLDVPSSDDEVDPTEEAEEELQFKMDPPQAAVAAVTQVFTKALNKTT